MFDDGSKTTPVYFQGEFFDIPSELSDMLGKQYFSQLAQFSELFSAWYRKSERKRIATGIVLSEPSHTGIITKLHHDLTAHEQVYGELRQDFSDYREQLSVAFQEEQVRARTDAGVYDRESGKRNVKTLRELLPNLTIVEKITAREAAKLKTCIGELERRL